MYKDETIEIVFSHLLDVGIQCIRLTSKLSFLYLYVIFLFTEHGQLTQFSLQLIKICTNSVYMCITLKDITLPCIFSCMTGSDLDTGQVVVINVKEMLCNFRLNWFVLTVNIHDVDHFLSIIYIFVVSYELLMKVWHKTCTHMYKLSKDYTQYLSVVSTCLEVWLYIRQL